MTYLCTSEAPNFAFSCWLSDPKFFWWEVGHQLPKYEEFGQLRMSWGQSDRQEKYELNYLKSYSLTLTLCFNFRFIHNVLIDGHILTMAFKNKKKLLIRAEINKCHEFRPEYEVFLVYYCSKVPQNWLGDEIYSKNL